MSDLKAVRKHAAQHDLFNRLHSIAADAKFVRVVASDWFSNRFEVVANQRCGTWYCDPSTSSKAYAYFKSTDGHTNNWNFNLRRSNLPFAAHAERQGGLILVDSTRRGKRMPDALSKTVPIWCAVINIALRLRREEDTESTSVVSESAEWDTTLYLPPSIVSPSERSQIQNNLARWAAALEMSTLPLPDLNKPLRPFFIHPGHSSPPQIPDEAPFTPIICVSASRWLGQGQEDIPAVTRLGRTTVGFEYVPGAGDDDELWARKLKPSVYHANRDRLLAADRDDLPSLVDEIVSQGKELSLSGLSLSGDSAHAGSSRPGPSRFDQSGKTVDESDKSGTTDDSPDSMSGLTPVPLASSHLAVALGDPVTSIEAGWRLGQEVQVVCTFWLARSDNVLPAAAVPISTLLDCHDFAIAVPDPRTHSKEYSSLAQHLVECVRLHHQKGHVVVLRAVKTEALRLVYKHAETAFPEDTVARLRVIRPVLVNRLDEENMVAMRKIIIPLVVALLVAIPSLCPMDEFEQGDEINKQVVADVLHQLVALWPDSNPPRAALKRINEVLMERR